MAFLGKRAKAELQELEARVPLLASAVRVQLSDPSWKNISRYDESSQRDARFYYQIIGAFNYAANWIGNACSRTEIYVADVDERGVVGKQTDDKDVSALADTLFGGPTSKAETIRQIAVALIVCGECFVIGKGRIGSRREEWMVVDPYLVRPYQGGLWVGEHAAAEQIPDGRALVFRVWKAANGYPWYSESPGRAALMYLRELEQIYKYKAAQTDSRLANAGLYPIPAGLDFTYGDEAPGGPSLQKALVDAANASLEGRGTAAQLVPIIFEVAADVLPHLLPEPIKFTSIMTDQIAHLESVALQQVAITMSVPPEIVLGLGNSTQWSAWEIGESAVKYHIEPLMNLIMDALNISYLVPALKKLGKDPARFTFQIDTSALTVRPNRFTDALNAYNASVDVLSAEAVRKYGDFKESDAPSDEERRERLTQQIVVRDPQLVMDPKIAEGLGIGFETSIPVDGVTPPPPVPGRTPVEGRQPTPQRPGTETAPGIIAAIEGDTLPIPAAVLAAADQAVRNALKTAGNRLLTPQYRGQFPDTPPQELHTKIRVKDAPDAERLLASAWTGLDETVEGTGVDADQLRMLLQVYTSALLRTQAVHSRGLLAALMSDHGLMPWQS